MAEKFLSLKKKTKDLYRKQRILKQDESKRSKPRYHNSNGKVKERMLKATREKQP